MIYHASDLQEIQSITKWNW